MRGERSQVATMIGSIPVQTDPTVSLRKNTTTLLKATSTCHCDVLNLTAGNVLNAAAASQSPNDR